MLDDKDIEKLVEVFATRDEVVTKKEFESFMEEFHNDINDLQKSVDAYAVKTDKYFQEHSMLSNKVDRHEKWIEKLSKNAKVKLEY
jgi:hypothetical protein